MPRSGRGARCVTPSPLDSSGTIFARGCPPHCGYCIQISPQGLRPVRTQTATDPRIPRGGGGGLRAAPRAPYCCMPPPPPPHKRVALPCGVWYCANMQSNFAAFHAQLTARQQRQLALTKGALEVNLCSQFEHQRLSAPTPAATPRQPDAPAAPAAPSEPHSRASVE